MHMCMLVICVPVYTHLYQSQYRHAGAHMVVQICLCHPIVVVDASVAALVIVFAIKIPSWLLPFLFYTQVSVKYLYNVLIFYCIP